VTAVPAGGGGLGGGGLGSGLDQRIGRLAGLETRRRLGAVAVPLGSVLVALLIGAILVALEGEDPVAVYAQVLRGVFVERDGIRNTFVAATPLIFMGVGLSLAYRAKAFTIGAEGQYVIGATAAMAFATAGGVRDAPAFVIIVGGLVIAALAGAIWSAICALLNARFGASVVITSLLLNYVAAAVLAWAVRVGIRDPKGFVPQSRQIGKGELPIVPWLDVHMGFVLAVALVAVVAVVMTRTRFGFRVDVLGHNPHALAAQETPPARMLLLVLAASGALAGLAGFVETAGVNGRLQPTTSAGLGFTAIIVAMLGRLRPIGALVAALGLSAMQIGFETAERGYQLPSSLVGVLQALVVLLVVAGDGLVSRREAATR
jgi:simple sugar transport system permease protein